MNLIIAIVFIVVGMYLFETSFRSKTRAAACLCFIAAGFKAAEYNSDMATTCRMSGQDCIQTSRYRFECVPPRAKFE